MGPSKSFKGYNVESLKLGTFYTIAGKTIESQFSLKLTFELGQGLG
jgi:hypothetical protein